MRLRALRGAITVPENDADAILAATEELVQEVMERNELRVEDMVSCIFTCTDDLDAEFPAVAARRLGLSAVPLLCAREIERAGLAPARDPAAASLLCRPRHGGPPRVPARGGVPAPRPGARTVSPGIEFNAHIADIPIYPAASTYEFEGELVKLASNETPFAPHPQVLEAVESGLRSLNRYPGPGEVGAAQAPLGAHRRAGGPDRDRQRLLRAAAGGRRRDARARHRDRLRLALVLDLPAHVGDVRRPRGHRAAERGGRARPRGDGARGDGRHPHRDRLQPQQPVGDRAARPTRSTRSWPSCRATWR